MDQGQGSPPAPPRRPLSVPDAPPAPRPLTLADAGPLPALARIPKPWLAALILVGAAAYLLLHTSYFLVRRVEVSGLVQLGRPQIAAALRLSPGTYLWQIRPWTLERRLDRQPLIAAAHVSLCWPDAVAVHVVERRPAILLATGGSYVLEVDASGRVLARAAPPGGRAPAPGLFPDPQVPLVTGVAARGRVRPGQVIAGPSLQHALAVAAGLGAAGRSLLGHIAVGPDGNVTVVLRSGLPVRFGDGSDARQKTELLVGLLAVIAKRHLQADAIDVASVLTPTVHVRAAATPTSTRPPHATATAPSAH